MALLVRAMGRKRIGGFQARSSGATTRNAFRSRPRTTSVLNVSVRYGPYLVPLKPRSRLPSPDIPIPASALRWNANSPLPSLSRVSCTPGHTTERRPAAEDRSREGRESDQVSWTETEKERLAVERKRRMEGGNERGDEAGETRSGGTGPWNVHARKRATLTHIHAVPHVHARAHTDAEREPMRLSRGRRAETGTGKAAGWSVRNEPRGG